MSILIISDLHFEKGSFHGVYQCGALDWLLGIVDKTKPTALVGLGDWGSAWTREDWNLLAGKVATHAIFGNHDDVYMLESIKNTDGSRVHAHDGEIRTIEGIKFGFINGIMSDKGTPKHNIPRSTSEDFLRISSNFKGIDVLCTHESPIVPEYGHKFDSGIGPAAMVKVIEKIKPKISVSGHLTFVKSYTISKIGESITIRIESGQVTNIMC